MVTSAWGAEPVQEEEPPPADTRPRVELVVEPVLDPDAFARLQQQLRDVVAQAVRDGFDDAVGGMGDAADDGAVPHHVVQP